MSVVRSQNAGASVWFTASAGADRSRNFLAETGKLQEITDVSKRSIFTDR
jgi:hypothetical protein